MSRRRAMSSVRGLSGGGALWTPYNSGTMLWGLDGADTSKFVLSGNDVDSWLDQSGNSSNAIAKVGLNKPLTNQESLNSLGTVTFDGTMGLTLNNSYFYGLSNQDHLLCIVIKLNSWTSQNFSVDDGARTRIVNSLEDTATRGLSVYYSENSEGGTSGPSIQMISKDTYSPIGLSTSAKTGWGIITVRKLGTSRYLQLDNNSAATDQGGTNISTVNNGCIGFYEPQNNGFLKGVIAEIWLMQGNEDINKIQGYVAHKRALTSLLDASHPYKLTAPTL